MCSRGGDRLQTTAGLVSGLHSDERKGVREVDREGSVDGGSGDLLPNGRGVFIFAGTGGKRCEDEAQ